MQRQNPSSNPETSATSGTTNNSNVGYPYPVQETQAGSSAPIQSENQQPISPSLLSNFRMSMFYTDPGTVRILRRINELELTNQLTTLGAMLVVIGTINQNEVLQYVGGGAIVSGAFYSSLIKLYSCVKSAWQDRGDEENQNREAIEMRVIPSPSRV